MRSEEPGSPPAELDVPVAELVRSAERLRTILEHAPVMIDSFDEDGRCVLWNRECEKTLGWSRQEIETAADPLSLFYPDEAERDRVLSTIAKAEGRFREYRVRSKDGSTRVQLWADFRLPTGEMIAVGHDVTEQRALEEQLRQAQKLEAIGRLSGGVAHDFNNLLTVVLGNMELITSALPAKDDGLRELAAEVQNAARRGARLIRNLLAFSRRAPLELHSVEPARVVGEIVGTLGRLLPESIQIELDSDEHLPLIKADPDALEQILINLATNARDAMPDGGSLRIELRVGELAGEQAARLGGRPGEYVSLSVSDDGSGMTAHTRQMAFEPFFTTKPPEQGSGLGLALVYGLMEQHRGFVELESGQGTGTTVTVYFPLDEAPVLETESEEAIAPPRGGCETILIAEDEDSIREVARVALEDHGYTVLLAGDGEEALSLVERHGSDIDLVVTDVVMPKLSGAGLYREARRLAPEVRFLLTTGYAERDVPAMGPELPPEVPLLQKPWTLQDLRAAVREILDG
jgi:PAS domain S-box-containing protein